jgi:hypothetical protein
MHIIQNKDDIILIMYNQSNAIICLKCRVKLLFFYIIKLYLFVERTWTCSQKKGGGGQHPSSSSNSVLKRGWLLN